MSSLSTGSSSAGGIIGIPAHLDWDPADFTVINVLDVDQKTLFGLLESLSDVDFGGLLDDQVDWQKGFAAALQLKFEKDAALVVHLNQREQSRMQRGILMARGTTAAVINTLLPNIGYAVIDEDGLVQYYELDSKQWPQRKITSALIRRVSDLEKLGFFVGKNLDVKAAKYKDEIKRLQHLRVSDLIYDEKLPSYAYSAGSAVGTDGHNMDRDIDMLLKLPCIHNAHFMEIFLGILPWDDKIFSISMFSPMGSVWGSLEVLIGALKLFTACSMFCFGKQMVQLEVIFLELLYDANVMEIGTDKPLYICYMVECKLRQLWAALRTQLTVNGAVVVLGNMGRVTYLRNVLHKVVLDATRIIQFDRNVRPTLPEVFLNPFSQGGNQMGNEVLDDEYDHNRRNVTHISSSRTSTSTRGPNTASEDNRKRRR